MGTVLGVCTFKDRVRGGWSVPLGVGDVGLPGLFDALDRRRYRGLFTLQVARGEDGREIVARQNTRDFVLPPPRWSCTRR